MLIDPDFLQELEDGGDYTEKTLAFVKKLMKGIRYVDINVAGSSVSGRVKTGDGENLEEVVTVAIVAIPFEFIGLTLTTGTQLSTGGNDGALVISTNASGQFAFSIAGSEISVSITPDKGVTTVRFVG